MNEIVLAIHLGAGEWKIDEATKSKIKRLIAQALEEGYKAGVSGSGVDIITKAIEVLEDSGLVNAGLGSVVDISGQISMDAGIMYSGYTKAGAVAYVKYPKNPIKLARYVMEYTDHVLIVGDVADRLAEKIGLSNHPGPTEDIVKKYNEALKKVKQGTIDKRVFGKSISLWIQLGLLDTVGAIAKDRYSELAAGVSTGGIFLKMPGRVGDSAIPGAGFYANKCGAAAATGVGEYIMMTLLTYRVVQEICGGTNVMDSVSKVLRLVTDIYGPGTAGVIAIDAKGHVYGGYNTKAMPWGYIDKDKEIRIFL